MRRRMAKKLITAKVCYCLIALTWMAGICSFLYLQNNMKSVDDFTGKIFEIYMTNLDKVDEALSEENVFEEDDYIDTLSNMS